MRDRLWTPKRLGLPLWAFLLLLPTCQNTPSGKGSPESPQAAPVAPPLGAPVAARPERSKLPEKKATPALRLAPIQETRKRRYVVAALGDSITDARSGGGGFLKGLRKRCPKSTFLNFGKGGDMSNQMRRRWEREIQAQVSSAQLTTLLVYGGVNDLYSDLTAGRTNDKIETDLSKIYLSAQKAGLEVVAITVSPWGGFSKYYNARRGQNTQLLNSWILAQEAAGTVTYAVDSYALLSCGESERLCPKFETRFHDGLHPGEQGHELLAKKLAKEAFSDCL